MFFYVNRLAELILLPPGCNLLLFALGLGLYRIKPKLGKNCIAVAILSLWLLSMPFVAQSLINQLQYQYPPIQAQSLMKDDNAAIVVLEAGLNLTVPEYEDYTVSESTLSRLRYAAFLHQKTQAPVLVSGNDPTHLAINQADYMANALRDYFHVPVRWKEDKGSNTALEGVFSTQILKQDGIKKLYLVTHAYHMPRSMFAFSNKGLEIVPAPTGYITTGNSLGTISAFLPTVESLSLTARALREYIGLGWYRFNQKIKSL